MLYAELSYGMYMFCWEYFFRGYLLLGLFRSIKWWAIIPQAVAFGLLHYGKPTTEIIASFGAGIILGVMAVYAKSFVPGFVLHWTAALTFDFLVVAGRPHH
jgi:membrane protease YdiL (CAAX protease family)